MLCSRCNRREANLTGTACNICMLASMRDTLSKVESTEYPISDDDVIKHHMIRIMFDGCRDCGDKNFGFEIGVQEEEEVKWYVANIHCGNCHSNYKEILEVRINESYTDSK